MGICCFGKFSVDLDGFGDNILLFTKAKVVFFGSIFAPIDLSDVALLRKMEVFLVLLEYTRDFGSSLSWTVVLCLKELYLLLYRCKLNTIGLLCPI